MKSNEIQWNLILAVGGSPQKSNYFLGSSSCVTQPAYLLCDTAYLLCDTPDMSAVRPSPTARRKTVVLCRRGGGQAPPPPATQNQRFAWCKSCMGYTRVLCRRCGGACPPPSCDTKPRFCVANKDLEPNGLFMEASIIYLGSQHLPYARSSELDRPEL